MFKRGEFENVELSEVEVEKLQRRLGIEETQTRIESLSIYMAAKRTKYKSHYAVILMWFDRDVKAGKVKAPCSGSFCLTENELQAQREKEHGRMFKAKK